jgi:hypothetical protein
MAGQWPRQTLRAGVTGARSRGRLGKKAHRRTRGCAGPWGHGRLPQESLCRAGAGGHHLPKQRGLHGKPPPAQAHHVQMTRAPTSPGGAGSSNGPAMGSRPGPGAKGCAGDEWALRPIPVWLADREPGGAGNCPTTNHRRERKKVAGPSCRSVRSDKAPRCPARGWPEPTLNLGSPPRALEEA